MSDFRSARHGLEPFLSSGSVPHAANPSVRVSVLTDLGHINLRGDAGDAAFTSDVKDVLGQSLPTAPNTFTTGTHRVYWLGPDEWQIVTQRERVADLIGRLDRAFAKLHASANDISSGQTSVRLSGPHARDVLVKGCTLDVHPRIFGTGNCAQSGLAKAAVLIACVDESSPVYDIFVRRSFADYLCRWLSRAAEEFDAGFETNSSP